MQKKPISSSKTTPNASVEVGKSSTCNQPKKMVLETERKSGFSETESIPKGPVATQKKSVPPSKLATPMASAEAGISNTCSQPKKMLSKTESMSDPVAAAQPRKAMTLEEQEEKFKETKRKLHEAYEKAENIKRQRKIQVMDVKEVMEHRLFQTRAVNGKRKWGHADGHRRTMAFY